MGGRGGDRSEEEIEAEIASFYDSVAFEYDDERDLWSEHYHAEVRSLMNTILIERKPKRILDVGVGSGKILDLYAAQGADVFGLDMSAKMLRVSSYKAAHLRLGAKLLRANAQRLPFSDGAFDFVACCGSVLNYCPNPEAAVAEFFRVLTRGGALAVGFDNSRSFDYLWILLDSISNHKLGYGVHIWDTIDIPTDNPHFVFYPYITQKGELTHMPERPLSYGRVAAALLKEGISIRYALGIHILSGLVPFTVISNPAGKPWMLKAAGRLCSLDSIMRHFGGFNRLAYHILVHGTKP